MPLKKKKTARTEETKEADDDVDEPQPKPKHRRKSAANTEVADKKKKKSKEEDSESEESEYKDKGSRKKGDANGKLKEKKKKNKSEEKEGEYDEVTSDEAESQEKYNNNDSKTKHKKKRAEEEVIKVTKKDKKKKSSIEDDQEEIMGSKDKKSKEGDKKSKKESDKEEDIPEEQEEDGNKKKKGKKGKKGSGDSDEDNKKGKGKKSKVKQVNYVEIYENELRNYKEISEVYDDDYHTKKVYEVVTITGDVRGAGTDANVFVIFFGEYGITPKVHLASKIGHDNTGMNSGWFLDRVVVTDMIRPHLRFYFACNNWLSNEEGDGLCVRDLLGSLDPMDVPKWERRLDNDKNNFERATEDKFTVESPNLGRIRKITIGHNNKGTSAGWFLEKVVSRLKTKAVGLRVMVDDMGNKSVYEFPVNRWFAIDEDDGKIQRDILVGGTQPTGIVYNVQVVTGNPRGAGTNSHVHMTMHGSKGLKNSGKVFLEGGKFERGLTDIFKVELAALLSPLSRVTIGHDNSGVNAGWYCEKVVIYCPFTGIEQTFLCSKWLDENEGDGLIERELYEMVSLRQKRQKKHPWSLWIWTSDVKGAGTDAPVTLQIYGENGKSDEMMLNNNSDNFEQAQLDKFMLTLVKTLTKEKFNFHCARWLDINEDDNEIIRELPATGEHASTPLPLIKYRVTVSTGKFGGSGTDATVFICLIGSQGDTGDRTLMNCKNNVNKFEKGNMDEFMIEAVSLGKIQRVRIGHDGQGGGSGWYLEKVVVREEGKTENEAIEFPSISYHIAVKTGNISGASSDSKVFVKLYGDKGDTSKMMLVVSDNNLSNYFETGRVDIFTIDTTDIGQINRLLIGHTNEGLRAGWFLDSVQIMIPVHGKQYMFPSHRWLCKDEADGKVEVEIYPMISYEVTVVTGDIGSAGTNANIFIQIYGDLGKTEVMTLKSRSNNFERGTTEIFKIEATDVGKIFKIRIGHDGSGLGDGWFLDAVAVRRLTMGMVQKETKKDDKKDKKKKKKKKDEDEEEAVAELQEVVETYSFPCQRWLARDEEDGELVVELLPEEAEELEVNTYKIYVYTGTISGAGTDANVYVNIYGENGDTGERWLRKSNNLNKFEKGQEDMISISAIDLGPLKKMRIRHDNSLSYPSWFLDRVEIVDLKDDTTYYFPCQRWLAVDEDDGQIARELVPVDEAFMKKDEEDEEGTGATLGLEQKAMSRTYTLKIKTGDKKYAGTDANVFAILYGEKDDSGIINLKACKSHKNKFERAMVDEFSVEAVDIGTLRKLRIGHDNSGGSPGWFLDWVEINAPSLGQKLRFPCGRWLDRGEDDGVIIRDLYPTDLQTEQYIPFVPYEITTFTSDLFGAGTDANVFIVLYGKNALCTEQKYLCVNKRERRLFFERNAEDMFIVELEDVGDVIEKIRIGHDNRGSNPGWHLDRVEIRRLLRKGKGSETTIFPCERWLAKSEDDGETVRELVPSDIIQEKLLRDGKLKRTETEVEEPLETHTYKVSIMTGDVFGAGTDANVFLTIYGNLGDTGERKLSKSETNKNKFERGGVDKFSMEAVDLGEIFKVRIRHDNTMVGADWYLDQVEVLDVETEEVYLFLCERWLSKKREDKRIERTFYVKGYEGEKNNLQSTKKSMKSLDSNMNKKNKKKKEEEIIEEGPTIPYHFTVSTGLDRDASTASRVYVIVIGPNQVETDRLWLDLADGKKCFGIGTMENFECYGTDISEIKMVELGHDGATPESCWLVDELSVAVPTKGIKYIFQCKCWLAKDRGDGLTARVFNVLDADSITITQKIIYEVTVVTGDIQNAGTDTKIYLSAFGANGNTEEILLQKKEDRFERGQEDTFNLEIDDIAPLKKIRVRTDGSGSRPDWFLDKIIMRNTATEDSSVFTYEQWLSKTKGPKRTKICELAAVVDEEEMVEVTTYTIQVMTSDVARAGTDANVYLIVFGENGDTGTLVLKASGNTNKFERKQLDVFSFPDILSLGELSKIRVWHDNKGPAPGWHLEFIDVKDEIMDQTFRFPCDRWLAKNEDDGQIMRELPCANHDFLDLNEKTKYEIATTTADMDDAETKENTWIVLEGKKGRSKEFVMENSSKKKKFLRGATDRFEFSCKTLGEIASICLGHAPKDGKKVKNESFWHVKEVVVTEKELGNKFIFRCDARIILSSKKDDSMTFECSKSMESFASKVRGLVPVKYEIIIVTGDVKGCGTDANVFITIYGSSGDSGKRALQQKFRNLFERGRTDRFILEMLDLGELQRVMVEHDNGNSSSGWMLDRVEVTNTANGVTTIFLCGKWLDTGKADGQIQRVLYPKY
ncbi:hypothetical protein AAFF_G00316770 [Aldrovandia affinis]|uniref:PLAT domain-containing protein n=1 Tax=Aldrovandia affinis TaxID=143900 RepID=A0AAD7SPD1_9TELE|nr:hypothetical protein AAFF_G00316770 [Aldrovandia affinis]